MVKNNYLKKFVNKINNHFALKYKTNQHKTLNK